MYEPAEEAIPRILKDRRPSRETAAGPLDGAALLVF